MNLSKKSILITGAAGFIGHHIVKELIASDNFDRLILVDNLSNGVKSRLSEFGTHNRIKVIVGDLASFDVAKEACKNVDIICHQAALGSVPRSIADPVASIRANITSFSNLCYSAHLNGISRIVYASSSSVYGDIPDIPKTESSTGKVMSPYAATKSCNETLADAFSSVYSLKLIGLRYFNIFGPGQKLEGPYAAVVPKFVSSALKGIPPCIYGDGKTSRDFTPVINAVNANLLAMTAKLKDKHTVFNIACNNSITIEKLWGMIQSELGISLMPSYAKSREGDIAHSKADISLAQNLLGYKADRDYKYWIQKTIQQMREDYFQEL